MKTRSDAKHAQGARVSERDEEGNTPLHLVRCLQTSLGNVALYFLLSLSLPVSLQFWTIFIIQYYFIQSTFINELYIHRTFAQLAMDK